MATRLVRICCQCHLVLKSIAHERTRALWVADYSFGDYVPYNSSSLFEAIVWVRSSVLSNVININRAVMSVKQLSRTVGPQLPLIRQTVKSFGAKPAVCLGSPQWQTMQHQTAKFSLYCPPSFMPRLDGNENVDEAKVAYLTSEIPHPTLFLGRFVAADKSSAVVDKILPCDKFQADRQLTLQLRSKLFRRWKTRRRKIWDRSLRRRDLNKYGVRGDHTRWKESDPGTGKMDRSGAPGVY